MSRAPIDDESAEPAASTRRPPLATAVSYFKYAYSFALLSFSVVLVMAAIFQEQTSATANMGCPPIAAFLVFWFLIIWLGVMEGGQGALVGLQMVDKSLYAESHPIALKNTSLVHKGDNMERFIVGRQFLTVLVIFIINMMASAIPDASVLGLPNLVNEIFLATGIALILTTIMLGQLTAQVNASNCMLDFINNYFVLFTIYISLLIEFTGLLHSVYLVQVFFAKVTGEPIESNEPPRTTTQSIFFWSRVLFSCLVLGFCFVVTLSALFQGQTEMWSGVPPAVSVVLFFLLMALVGLMEGMQIALFAVVNLPEEELKQHSLAQQVCKLTFTGHHLQAFLIGRQICVTLCMFIVARITSLNVETGQGDNIFGVPDELQAFFNTGLLGALISTIVGSLAWRIIASSFPVEFLSNPLVYVILRVCLILELSGLCSAAWILALVQRKVAKFQPDDTYIGKAEEREARYHEFDDEQQQQEKLGEEPPVTPRPGRRTSNFNSSEMALYLSSHTLFADDAMAESLVDNAEETVSTGIRRMSMTMQTAEETVSTSFRRMSMTMQDPSSLI